MAEDRRAKDGAPLDGASYRHVDLAPLPAGRDYRLMRILSDAAVRLLVRRYGARLDAEEGGAAGGSRAQWVLTLLTPITISIRATDDRVLASAQGLGWASGWSARDALINLARELREEARKIRNDAEVGRWFSEAWPGLSYSYSTPEWKRRLLPAIEETLHAVEDALRAAAGSEARDADAAPA